MKLEKKCENTNRIRSRSVCRASRGGYARENRSTSCPPKFNCSDHSRSEDLEIGDKFVWDKRNCLHYKWSRSGTSYVYNRASKFYSSSTEHHMKDLEDIGIKKPGLIFITDGGPDWSPKFMKNLLALGKFWKNNKLDFLIQVTYAPGHSAQNPVDQHWLDPSIIEAI